MLVLGWVAMSVGVLLVTASLVATLHANPNTLVPYNRNPVTVPRHSVLVRSVGAGPIIVATAVLLSQAGPWQVVVPALVASVWLSLMLHHTSGVRRAAATR